ncbi:metallophosphoesterase family protein [Asticcacaulis solisilvae]|uniref:metallophosphoesterase family protein n=1 Tax=Asticcacaulis solisilvae TaxID=1217274 RepID=UPI003FD7871A
MFNARALLETLAEQRVDIVLAGHHHHAYVETQSMDGHTTLFVNASTATSNRLRRQPNGFNMLEFTGTSVRIDMLRYKDEAFAVFEAVTHSKHA